MLPSLNGEPSGDVLVHGELNPVVRDDGPGMLPVGEEQPDDYPCREASLPLGNHCMSRKLVGSSVRVRMAYPSTMVSISQSPNRLLLAFAGLRCMLIRSLMLAASVGPRSLAPGVLQRMRHVGGQPSHRIGMDVVVDGLPADADAPSAQNARHLPQRPALHEQTLDNPPQAGWLPTRP